MNAPRIALVLLAACPGAALAEPTATNAAGQVELIIQDHRFAPTEIRVPAGKRIEILVRNQDDTAEEFESRDLKIEKVIAARSEGVVRLRPLDPGRYPFVGEFHEETAQGVVIAE